MRRRGPAKPSTPNSQSSKRSPRNNAATPKFFANENDLRGSYFCTAITLRPYLHVGHDIEFDDIPRILKLGRNDVVEVRVVERANSDDKPRPFLRRCEFARCTRHAGHFVYAPERNGVPVYMCRGIPRELWGKHECDHEHLLPWVPVRPEHRVCRERSSGTTNITIDARVPRTNRGQALARLRSPTPQTTRRLRVGTIPATCAATSWSLFWVKGRLSANDMVSAIMRDFPRLWTRITKPFGMATHGGDVEPAPRTTSSRALPRREPRQAHVHRRSLPGALGIACRNDHRSHPRSRCAIRSRACQDGVVCPRSSSE